MDESKHYESEMMYNLVGGLIEVGAIPPDVYLTEAYGRLNSVLDQIMRVADKYAQRKPIDETGQPVQLGEKALTESKKCVTVDRMVFHKNGSWLLNSDSNSIRSDMHDPSKCVVKRPVPMYANNVVCEENDSVYLASEEYRKPEMGDWFKMTEPSRVVSIDRTKFPCVARCLQSSREFEMPVDRLTTVPYMSDDYVLNMVKIGQYDESLPTKWRNVFRALDKMISSCCEK